MNVTGITEPVVLLVDDKKRDLNGAVLIAMHLRRLGVESHLEPLEAFRAVLAAYRPGMVIFNHLTAGHLVAWSRRLADMGVLTAVLPNEGIAYDPHDMAFIAGRHHNGAHVDFNFCWNEPYRRALIEEGAGDRTRMEVVGVPRFDFYFEPWSRILPQLPARDINRPRVLFCTSFQTARFWKLPKADGDKFFAPWFGRIPRVENYWRSIEAHWKSRQRSLDYLDALLKADKFEVILRPHPREDPEFYTRWIAGLPAARRRHLRFDATSPISALILGCDLEISCETCTTAIESWVAGKPTIELVFEHDPMWYCEEHARANIECDDPPKLPGLVEQQLRDPAQSEKREIRRRHLEKWCATPDGGSSLRLAQIVTRAMREKKPADWSKLTANDYRRAAKLLAFRKLGLAYHYDPLLALKRRLFRKRYALKHYVYEKSIKPGDVREARVKLERIWSNGFASATKKSAA
jgi:surface carbohydrate biosynthesis protein